MNDSPMVDDCVVCHLPNAPWNGVEHVHEYCDLAPTPVIPGQQYLRQPAVDGDVLYGRSSSDWLKMVRGIR